MYNLLVPSPLLHWIRCRIPFPFPPASVLCLTSYVSRPRRESSDTRLPCAGRLSSIVPDIMENARGKFVRELASTRCDAAATPRRGNQGATRREHATGPRGLSPAHLDLAPFSKGSRFNQRSRVVPSRFPESINVSNGNSLRVFILPTASRLVSFAVRVVGKL